MEPDWKGLESRGREKPPCSWAVPAAALREAEPSWLTPLRVSREEGGSGGLLCSGVGALLGTSYQSLVVEKLEISKEYSGLFFFFFFFFFFFLFFFFTLEVILYLTLKGLTFNYMGKSALY